jgi:hypothetical protein
MTEIELFKSNIHSEAHTKYKIQTPAGRCLNQINESIQKGVQVINKFNKIHTHKQLLTEIRHANRCIKIGWDVCAQKTFTW